MQVAEIISDVLGQDVPVRVVAYDGSKAGPDSSEVALRVLTPRALARLVTAPGTLGLARAYVGGRDRGRGRGLRAARRDGRRGAARPEPRRAGAARAPVAAGLAPPPAAVRRTSSTARRAGCTRSPGTGRRSRTTTTSPTGSTSGCSARPWPTRAPSIPTATATLEEAQAAKHELVAQKLGLEPGMRLLDVGCGWGGMVMHAAAEHGVKALGRHAVAQPGRVGAGRDRAPRARRPRRGAPPRLPRRAGVGVRRDQLDRAHRAHRQGPAAELLRLPARSGCGPGGRLLNHCITQPRNPRAPRARPVLRPLRLPGRPAGADRAPGRRDERRRLRDPPRGEPAGALRAHPRRAGAPTSRSTGTRPSPRSASGGRGCGGSTWRRAGSGSTATTSSCTRCSA